MSRSKRIVALIPARGGSKGVARKNIRSLAGKPMIAWTIEAARNADGIDRVIVSTEDPEIAEVARACGAEIPFIRPLELARDDTPAIAPVLHAINWMSENENDHPDQVMLLQPTSPLRTVEDIAGAVTLASVANVDSIVSITELHQHPYWAMTMNSDGRLRNFLGADLHELGRKYPRRQDMPAAYGENGAIYLVERSVLLADESFYGRMLFGYVMPPERSLDIDSQYDFDLADTLLRRRVTYERD